jgi:hypothetical protein
LFVTTEDIISEFSPPFVRLVDDTVRFLRADARGFGMKTVTSGVLSGESSVEYHAFMPTLADHMRLAAGENTTIVFSHLPQDLNERQLRSFAEMKLRAPQSPQLRAAPASTR